MDDIATDLASPRRWVEVASAAEPKAHGPPFQPQDGVSWYSKTRPKQLNYLGECCMVQCYRQKLR